MTIVNPTGLSSVRAVHHLVGAAEAAELLGVTRQRLHVLAKRPGFPEPVAVLAAGLIWEREAVEQWAREHGRAPRPRPGDDT